MKTSRRAARTLSPETRLKISATLRSKDPQSGALAWDEAHIVRLREAYGRAGYRGVLTAFPDVPTQKLYYAVRRHCLPKPEPRKREGPSCWDDPEFQRRWMRVLTGLA